VKIFECNINKSGSSLYVTRQRLSMNTFSSLPAFDVWASNKIFTPLNSYFYSLQHTILLIFSLCCLGWKSIGIRHILCRRRQHRLLHRLNRRSTPPSRQMTASSRILRR
jgi:hypothetical protein